MESTGSVGSILIVDGADICRAPIVEFTLRTQLAAAGWLNDVEVASRGLDVEDDRIMCESASVKLGYSGPAIAFYGAHRSRALDPDEVADAGLVLTAERQHRSNVVRMVPGTQAKVFTWKEALVLATVVADRSRSGAVARPADLDDLARALHAARGTIPLIEPMVRTNAFHWRRGQEADVLTVQDGHADAALHQHTTTESHDVARTLGARLADLVEPAAVAADAGRGRRWWRQRA